MALATIVTLEKELPDAMAAYSKAKAGKALARESDRLDSVVRRKNVPAITSMLSESQAKLIEQLRADGFDPSKMRLPPEQWFSPSEGLKTVRALAEYVAANLNDFKQPNPVLRDLKATEALLAEAERAGARFHFTKVDL
jgi:glycine/D-amino acid oxidase-like deaminating enzyme